MKERISNLLVVVRLEDVRQHLVDSEVFERLFHRRPRRGPVHDGPSGRVACEVFQKGGSFRFHPVRDRSSPGQIFLIKYQYLIEKKCKKKSKYRLMVHISRTWYIFQVLFQEKMVHISRKYKPTFWSSSIMSTKRSKRFRLVVSSSDLVNGIPLTSYISKKFPCVRSIFINKRICSIFEHTRNVCP